MAPTTAPPVGRNDAARRREGGLVQGSASNSAPPPGMFTMPPSGSNYYTLKDQVTGKKRDAPPVSPFAPYALMTTPAFDLDFRYMEKPGYEPDLFDPIKRIHLRGGFLAVFRRQLLVPIHAGVGCAPHYHKRQLPHDTQPVSCRLLVSGQGPIFRGIHRCAYVWAGAGTQPTDVNYTDMLNLFADVKVATVKDAPAYIRFGRQELLYGRNG